jgi:hypothetical protein
MRAGNHEGRRIRFALTHSGVRLRNGGMPNKLAAFELRFPGLNGRKAGLSDLYWY